MLITMGVAWGLMLSSVPAQAFIYWTSSGGKARATLDGSGVVDPLFSTASSNFAGLAVGGSYLYWTASQAIGRATIDGCDANPAFVPVSGPAAQDPIDVAVDASHIYWTNGGVAIGRANLDGTGVNESFIGGIQPVTVTSDANYIYWANQKGAVYSIGRANLDGTAPNASFIPLSAPAGRLAVDAAHIYWVNSSGHAIGRANLNGTSPNESFIAVTGSPGNPSGVAVDATYVYWSHDLNAIGRATLSGTVLSANFITSTNGLAGLAVDSLAPGAEFCAAPSALSFAARAAGTGPSASQTVTVTNNGAAPLHISSIVLAGVDPSQFTLGADTCSGTAVASAGGTCSVAVAFSPTSTGAHSAILRFMHDAANRPTDVALTGTATAAAPGAGTGTTPGGGAGGGLDNTPPSVLAFSISPSKFVVGAQPTAIVARKRRRRPRPQAKTGATFSYMLSKDGGAQIAISAAVAGLRRGGTCAPLTPALRRAVTMDIQRRLSRKLNPAKRRNRIAAGLRAARCTATTTFGTLVRPSAHIGANTLAFSGRISRTPLRAGPYTATLTGTNTTGARSAPRTVRFSIVAAPHKKRKRH